MLNIQHLVIDNTPRPQRGGDMRSEEEKVPQAFWSGVRMKMLLSQLMYANRNAKVAREEKKAEVQRKHALGKAAGGSVKRRTKINKRFADSALA